MSDTTLTLPRAAGLSERLRESRTLPPLVISLALIVLWYLGAIWPAVGSSSPAIICSKVDLPQPERPSRQTKSPASQVKSMRRSASTGSFLPG